MSLTLVEYTPSGSGGSGRWLQVLLVAHVVVGQVEQVLEFVEVQLAGVKGRVFGGVVLEVDDVDVDAGLLGVLLELDPFGVGSADHADLDRVALAALGGRLVGTGKRAVAEERGHGDNRHDHDGDDDVAGGVVHTHRSLLLGAAGVAGWVAAVIGFPLSKIDVG